MMVLPGKLLLICIIIAVAWSCYEACRERRLQKRKAQWAERDLDRLSHQLQELFGPVLFDVESMNSLLEDEVARDLIKRLIVAYRYYAETHPLVDCEPEIGRLMRWLLKSGPASMVAG